MAKYEITDIEHPRIKGAYRIRALKSFSDVKQGDLGGWIDGRSSLSQRGKCWLDENSYAVYGASIEDNAKVVNSTISASTVGDDAVIINSTVSVQSGVYGNAVVKDSKVQESGILNNSTVQNKSVVENSSLRGKSFTHNARVYFSVLDSVRCIGSHLYRVDDIKDTTVYGKVKLTNYNTDFLKFYDGTWPERIDAKVIKEMRDMKANATKRHQSNHKIPVRGMDKKTAIHLADEYSYAELRNEYNDDEIKQIFELAGIDF